MPLVALIAGLAAGLAAWGGTTLVRRMLLHRDVLDRPNERSSHARPVPRGGGIAVIGVVLGAWLALALRDGSLAGLWPLLAAALALALVSFLDDLRSLPAAPRLAAHAAAVALGALVLLPGDALLFGGALPWALDRLVVALAWLWFVELFNFMDGIDGITGVETIAVAGGLALIALVMGQGPLAPYAAVLVGAAAGFLVLNWHPARIFLGDVGSVPLGYLLGWLLAWQACVEGLWWLALLLPLYHWGDATTTLLRRGLKREKVWQAHRSHAYQVAVQAGWGHGAVSGMIALLNAWLVALALGAALGVLAPWLALAIGAVSVAVALCYLRGRPAGGRR